MSDDNAHAKRWYEDYLARHEEREAKAERARICVEAMAGIDDPVVTFAAIREALTILADSDTWKLDGLGDPNSANFRAQSLAAGLLSRIGGGE